MMAGRCVRALGLAFGLALMGSALSSANETPASPAAEDAASANGAPPVPACATDTDKLGLERIVEIDTSTGGVYGGSNHNIHFLKDREVVLTFDDGPMRAYTRRILQALEAHCTRATFFMVGRMAAADPAMVKEVLAAGHTVGTHTFSHKNLRPLGLLKGRQEFESGLSAVQKAAGTPVAPFFRFPYLGESRQVVDYLKTRQTATFFIDVDSKDFQTRNSSIVLNRIMTQLTATKKGIILMHDIQPSTAGVIRELLDTLHQKGFKVVHMVPKAAATTVADYDTGVDKALATNSSRLKEQPLADRSMVWTMPENGKGPAKKSGASSSKQAAPATTASTNKSSGTSGSEQLPWTKPAPAKAASTATPSKRPQRRDEELPWQARIFSN